MKGVEKEAKINEQLKHVSGWDGVTVFMCFGFFFPQSECMLGTKRMNVTKEFLWLFFWRGGGHKIILLVVWKNKNKSRRFEEEERRAKGVGERMVLSLTLLLLNQHDVRTASQRLISKMRQEH